jgi:translocator assembly and maintenance protein 41
MVARAVRSIVRASSFRQMISGFLAAGGVNAAHYVARKVNKAWQSRH